ncbi:MAG: fibronectin type III domain-containing protein [Bacteroidales bacterium]|jgi:hypothetical protein|nr:fibronectin type III domain-containing protein [Bacteroidales bacterium]
MKRFFFLFVAILCATSLGANGFVYSKSQNTDDTNPCQKPTNIILSNPTTSSIDISWSDDNSSVLYWLIKYTSISDTLWENAQQLQASNNPFTLNDLLPNQTYKLIIQSNCSSSDESLWSDSVVFTTLCESISLIAWNENFEAFEQYSFPQCWRKFSSFSAQDVSYPYIESADYSSHSNPNSLKFGTSSNSTCWAITPAIGQSIETLQLSFWAKAEADVSGTIEVGILSSQTDTSSFESVMIVQPSTTYSKYEIPFALVNSIGTNKYIAFKQNGRSQGYFWWIDDIELDYIPFCPKPNDVNISNITTSSAELSWNDITGNSSSWTLQYKPSSVISWDSAYSFQINTQPYTINNLSSASIYDLRMKADCISEESPFTNPITFKTQCEDITLIPYTMDFETTLQYDKMPICWQRTEDSFIAGSEKYPYIVTNNANNGSKALAFYSTQSTYSYAILPKIDVQNSDLSLRFWAKSLAGTLSVFLMSDDEQMQLIEDITLNANTYQRYDVTLPEEALTEKQYVVFRYNTSTYKTGYIDDLTIDYPSLCNEPTNISVNNITTSSALISWDEVQDDETPSWILEYMDADNTSWEGATSLNVGSIPFTLSGLTDAKTYKFRVKTICENSQSAYSNETSFTTLCLPLTSFPYTIDFDDIPSGSGNLPVCWQKPSYSNGNYPYVYSSSNVHSGEKSLRFYADGSNYAYAIMPQIGVDISSLQVKFWAKSNGGTLSVGVISIPEDASSIQIFQDINLTSSYQEYEVLFDQISGVNLYIVLRYNSQSYFEGYVDDVVIDYIPLCPKQTSLRAYNPTDNSIDLTWIDPNGNANLWDIEYMLASDTSWDEAQTIPTSSYPYTITSLLQNTTYKLRVKASCLNEESPWSDEVICTTLCDEIITIPFVENFESLQQYSFPSCWRKISSYNKTSTNYYYPFVETDQHKTGEKSLAMATKKEKTAYAITPPFSMDLSLLKIKCQIRNESSTNSGSLELGIMSDLTDTTTFQSIISFDAVEAYNTWVEKEIYLDQVNTGDCKFIAFKQTAPRNNYYWWIDDIEINYITNCASPYDLSINETNTMANLQWAYENNSGNGFQVRLNSDGDTIEVYTNSYLFTNLTPNTQYTAYIRAICDNSYSSWRSISFTTTNIEAGAITYTPISISQFSAILSGEYVGIDSEPLCKGFYYRNANSTSWTRVISEGGTNPYTILIDNLIADNDYIYKAFVKINENDSVFGQEVSFHSLAIVPAIVETLDVTNIEANSATFSATIEQGTLEITSRSFQLIKENDLWSDATIITGQGTSPFVATYNSLLPNTPYIVRAVVTTGENDDETYGNEVRFNTPLSLLDIDNNRVCFDIYPNPAKGNTKLYIQNAKGDISIKLFDVYSRIVKTIKIKANSSQEEYPLDLSSLFSGTYYIQILTENNSNISTQKLIIL